MSRPFGKRFQSRLDLSPGSTPRAQSPAFLDHDSRPPSLSSQFFRGQGQAEGDSAPPSWDVVRWIKLKKITTQAFSEAGKRRFGTPTCIAASAFVAVGTSKGVILIFDYSQNLKTIVGPGTEGMPRQTHPRWVRWKITCLYLIAVESGPVWSLAFSADQTTVAGGHANGNIFTWELSRPAKPFLHIPPLGPKDPRSDSVHGHVSPVSILHLAFLGARRTALVSADGRGMAFSHLATRGLSLAGRTVKTSRILGRYPSDLATGGRTRKPSSVLACSALPLGNVEQATDTMGLVAMLTPYLLVIVSTTPIAQTQHKSGRPKEVTAHGALSGCLAWFPAVRLRNDETLGPEAVSRSKVAYCWCHVLTLLELADEDMTDSTKGDRPPSVSFRVRARWKANESIVAVQWLSRSILAVLTITQQLVILEDHPMRITDTVDLISRQISHHDFFSEHLRPLVERPDETDTTMPGLVANVFSTSFRVHKGRIFLLGANDISVGLLSGWADRLTALMDDGKYLDAIRLATQYLHGEVDVLAVGLPNNQNLRRSAVSGKLFDVMSATLTFLSTGFGPDESQQLKELSGACFAACTSLDGLDFLFDHVYEFFEGRYALHIFLESLGSYILSSRITSVPPSAMKALVDHYVSLDSESQLEEMICRMNTDSMDIDQITNLCRKHGLYDALIYVWNQALGDCITPLIEMLSILIDGRHKVSKSDDLPPTEEISRVTPARKIFPYLSYALTGRLYPTGDIVGDEKSLDVKDQLYSFLLAGTTVVWPKVGGRPFLTQAKGQAEPAFPYLRLLLHFDAASLLSALDEAFEDPFLNESSDDTGSRADPGHQYPKQTLNRQYIISILWEIMYAEEFSSDQTVCLDMFIARNLSKFPQYILLPGTLLRRVLVGLCNFSSGERAEDCQLSIEYLLSIYRPADLNDMAPRFKAAGFFRVLKSLYKNKRQYGDLLQTYFDDVENREDVFMCMEDCLRQRSTLKERQFREVRQTIHGQASGLLALDPIRTADIIERYAPEWHEVFLKAAATTRSRFVYLRTILEPRLMESIEVASVDQRPNREYIEEYVRLMCTYEPSHVADYISLLQVGELRLERVLPEMENEGIVDAAVVLTAREGRVREAMDRLTRHFTVLEAALLGALDGSTPSDDGGGRDGRADITRAVQGILEALQKYSQVGIWLCQRQLRSAQLSGGLNQPKPLRSSSLPAEQSLSFEELLWLDLIDSTVRVVQHVTVALPPAADEFEVDSMEISRVLRGLVQQTFTVLLTTTTSTASANRAQKSGASEKSRSGDTTLVSSSTSTSSGSGRHRHLAFLHILRAFLARASLSSPSLSELRDVLASIFSAYAYEESLLSLSNKLLQEDLFVHVAEIGQIRQRGWRPRAQICEICSRKVWGPGVGGRVWEAWRTKTAAEEEGRRESTSYSSGPGRRPSVNRRTLDCRLEDRSSRQSTPTTSSRSKERELPLDRNKGEGRRIQLAKSRTAARGGGGEVSLNDQTKEEWSFNEKKDDDDGLGPLVIFSCQHLFHQSCLVRMMNEDGFDELRRRGGVVGGVVVTEEGRDLDGPMPSGMISRDKLRCVVCPRYSSYR